MSDEPKNVEELAGWLSVEFNVHKEIPLACQNAVRVIDAYVSARISEAEAAMAQRAAEESTDAAKFKRMCCSNLHGYAGLMAGELDEVAKEILALSPDPTWLERRLLDARIEEAKFLHKGWVNCAALGGICCDVAPRIAELISKRDLLDKAKDV